MAPPSIGRHTVSVVAIIALAVLGGGWAWADSLSDATIQLFIIAGIAGLGGYNIKRSQVLSAERKSDEEE